VSKELTEKYGYNINDMSTEATNLFPVPGNDPYNLDFEAGYSSEYKGRSLGEKVYDFITGIGSGAERGEGSNFVIGKTSGQPLGKSDAQAKKMNMFDPKIKNNFPRIVLPKK
jgi:hypothetical protein